MVSFSEYLTATAIRSQTAPDLPPIFALLPNKFLPVEFEHVLSLLRKSLVPKYSGGRCIMLHLNRNAFFTVIFDETIIDSIYYSPFQVCTVVEVTL